ncbi:GntR family transcriptional regulator [Terracoccus luteus]|uniref:DNA-binding GntR family transcriptional regulator n=1 Tax=Terracoccus luteus TaxID=53356 RepID=A0A839PQX1_9MICO|nr:GntR family transcriptional regulator [Terracoccus luteus]MBB2985234.1 DNA-binding GntR family transcriptional regulator [Terracoccus luteus]MCP2170886.1 DNA-binding GntR family transcriptional regulator [Terracoccus luteus]
MTTLTPVSLRRIEHTESLRERVRRALVAAIVTGELAPGQLVSVPTLATRFNVSATPVREAILELEKSGFVEPVRNKGFRITVVSEDSLRHVAAVRLMIEPVCMERLAGAFPTAALAELRAGADRIVEGARTGDLVAYLEADTAFHVRLTAMVGNPVAVDIVSDLRSRARLLGLSAMAGTNRLVESAHEHHELLELLAAGDGAGARALMERHIGHSVGLWAGQSEPAPARASAT